MCNQSDMWERKSVPAQCACASQNTCAVGTEGTSVPEPPILLPKYVGLIVPEPPFCIYSYYQIIWVLVCQNPYFVYTLKSVFDKG